MIIEKDIYSKRKLILLGLFGTILLTSCGYFLGWDIDTETFITYISIIILEIAAFLLLYLILKRRNKKYYEFKNETIYFIDKEIKITIKATDIIKIFYVRYFWIFFLQMGAGELHFQYQNSENEVDCDFISMSLKEAKQVDEILNLRIEIR